MKGNSEQKCIFVVESATPTQNQFSFIAFKPHAVGKHCYDTIIHVTHLFEQVDHYIIS